MVIIGAKGFAKEVLEILWQNNKLNNIAFYDDVNSDIGTLVFERFPILKSEAEIVAFFEVYGNDFTLGIGNPLLREKLFRKFSNLGGQFCATISPFAHIGHFGTELGMGCNVMTGTVITNDVKVGMGALINLNCTIGHDSVIGDFVELSPGVHVSGNCIIGTGTNIGTNATILPQVEIGRNVIIGAGAVVTGNIPDNTLAVGIPAKVIKENIQT